MLRNTFGRAEPDAARAPSTNPTASQPFRDYFNILFLLPRFLISTSFLPLHFDTGHLIRY